MMKDPYKLTAETYDKVAQSYQDKFMDLDLYNDTYMLFLELLPRRDERVFEIGCGPGNITRYLLSARPELQIEAIDVAPNMVRLARENNPSAKVEVMDCRAISGLTPGFGGIMCGFCMPYLSKEDCVKLIRDSAALLRPEGILYFSVIEDDYGKSGYETNSAGDGMYIYYHEEDFLQRALEDEGFETLHKIRKSYPGPSGTSSTHLIFIAKNKR